jgi:hypothetical protein
MSRGAAQPELFAFACSTAAIRFAAIWPVGNAFEPALSRAEEMPRRLRPVLRGCRLIWKADSWITFGAVL